MQKFLSFLLLFVVDFVSTSERLEQPTEVQVELQKLPDDYWYVPALSDDERAEFKKLIDRITEDVLSGKNENEAEKVYNSRRKCVSMTLVIARKPNERAGQQMVAKTWRCLCLFK